METEGCSSSFHFGVISDALEHIKVILPSQRLDRSTRRTKAPGGTILRLLSLEVPLLRVPVELSIPALADQTFTGVTSLA